MHELFWLLLPVAAASGWFAAIRARRNGPTSTVRNASLRSTYLKGINYFLEEQQDKAAELFASALESDSDTVETHLALGTLFRRRGEVDRAIAVHQRLIDRSGLSAGELADVLLELGQDYMHAGLLDRAEGLFQDLVGTGRNADRALAELADIYQREKEWDKAVETVRHREALTGTPYGQIIAHFYCEQAVLLRRQGKVDEALKLLHQALDVSSQCVRATLMEGDLLQEHGDTLAAIRAYRRVEQQDPDYLPEIIQPLRDCHARLGRSAEMAEYLNYILERYGGIEIALALAELIREEEGEEAAIGFLSQRLRWQPSVNGMVRLIEMSQARADGPAGEQLLLLKELGNKLLENRHAYRCRHCGFAAKSLHWQCPGCRSWGTVKPMKGLETG